MINGIDHPAIAADNLDLLSDWYHGVLGYEKHFYNPEKNVWILKAPDGTFLEMMQKDDSPRPKRNVLTSGLSHLAYRVDNLDNAIKFLDDHKVEWISDVVDAIGGGKLRSFNDPEGNMLQVVQR
ncbi:MAG: VOC family protein [Cyclobacteriaceae bacterium]|nr:VOC family protein [Cyclobacteriaceae bacterium]